MAVVWHPIGDEIKLEDHSARHEDGGADEISVTALSGLLADYQHAALSCIDGGDLGDSADLCVPATIRDAYDAMTGAMSSLFVNLDGGVL